MVNDKLTCSVSEASLGDTNTSEIFSFLSHTQKHKVIPPPQKAMDKIVLYCILWFNIFCTIFATPVILRTTFDLFQGGGFVSNPSAGQLDSDEWILE